MQEHPILFDQKLWHPSHLYHQLQSSKGWMLVHIVEIWNFFNKVEFSVKSILVNLESKYLHATLWRVEIVAIFALYWQKFRENNIYWRVDFTIFFLHERNDFSFSHILQCTAIDKSILFLKLIFDLAYFRGHTFAKVEISEALKLLKLLFLTLQLHQNWFNVKFEWQKNAQISTLSCG